MKKYLLSIFLFSVLMVSCHKEDITPVDPPKQAVDIFSIPEASISDGEEIIFKLKSDSTYILKLTDQSTGQVLSKEKIQGIVGIYKMNLWTKSIPSKNVYLILEDQNKSQLGKTTIIIK